MSKTRLVAILAVVIALSVVSSSAFAHHGTSSYDLTKTITGKATVTSLQWENPHCVLNFDMKDDKGAVTHWSVEMYNPLYMSRSGWNRNLLKSGDEIDITFHPAKNGTGAGYVRDGDGKIIFNGKPLSLAELP
jgi:Family of unknown function (DUF6152)